MDMDGVWTDAFGFLLEERQAPFTVSVVPFRNMIFLCGVVSWNFISSVRAEPLVIIEDLHGTFSVADLNMLSDKAVGNAVEVTLDIDVVVDPDPAHAQSMFAEHCAGGAMHT